MKCNLNDDDDGGTRIASSANEKLLIEMTTQLKLAKKFIQFSKQL
jgi:hypothetical protein